MSEDHGLSCVLGLAAPPRLNREGERARKKKCLPAAENRAEYVLLIWRRSGWMSVLVGCGRLVVGFVLISWHRSNTRKGETGRKATQRFKLAIKLIKVQAPPMHDNLL